MAATPSSVRPGTRLGIEAATRARALGRRRAGADAVTAKTGRDLVTAAELAVEGASSAGSRRASIA
jgi:hypothetical protein